MRAHRSGIKYSLIAFILISVQQPYVFGPTLQTVIPNLRKILRKVFVSYVETQGWMCIRCVLIPKVLKFHDIALTVLYIGI